MNLEPPYHVIRPEDDPDWDEFKKTLGPLALTLSDREIGRIRYTLKRFASIAFDQWLQKRNTGVFPSEENV